MGSALDICVSLELIKSGEPPSCPMAVSNETRVRVVPSEGPDLSHARDTAVREHQGFGDLVRERGGQCHMVATLDASARMGERVDRRPVCGPQEQARRVEVKSLT